MNLAGICEKQRDKLLPKWVDAFFSSYALDSVGLLRTQSDPFTNPVGEITRRSLAVLYSAVVGSDVEQKTVSSALEELVRVRAVQDMPPTSAVGALFLLKPILREYLLPQIQKATTPGLAELLQEYLDMESRLDSLALLAFDLYSANRETVFNIKVEEIKRGQSQITRWATLRQKPAYGAGIAEGE